VNRLADAERLKFRRRPPLPFPLQGAGYDPAPMRRPAAAILLVLIAALGLLGAGCDSDKPIANNRGAELFSERCSGCHTLSAAGARGSVGERISGPNLDQRHETKDQVLFAIRNGGFSGAIMPQNIVVGKDADEVAEFVARYAGSKAKAPPAPTGTGENAGATGTTGEQSR
jgi:mono/diheme cytochrome c family protein